MKELINKKTLEKLAELARTEIGADKEKKLLEDLEEILEYFEELKEVNVSGIEPMSGPLEAKLAIGGAVELVNVFRDDEPVKSESESIDLIDAFPEKEREFLKVPGVFE